MLRYRESYQRNAAVRVSYTAGDRNGNKAAVNVTHYYTISPAQERSTLLLRHWHLVIRGGIFVGKYNIYFDGVARRNHGPAGIGMEIVDEQGNTVVESGRYLGISTHNTADYEALVLALEHAVKNGMEKVTILSDSKLLVRQINGQYQVKNKVLRQLMSKVEALADGLEEFEICCIPKQANQKARLLAEEAIAAAGGGVAEPSPTPETGANPVPEPPTGEPAHVEEIEPETAAEAVEGVTWRVLSFTPQIMLVQFNYKKGAKIPVHRHLQEQACYVIKGRVKYTLADQDVILTPGLGITIQGYSDHSLEAQAASIEIVTYAPMRGDLFHK